MTERYPGLHGHEDQRPFEFDLMRKHVFIGVPESAAREVVEVVAEAAWSAGVAVFDPQRESVALPPPYGDAPMGLDGIDAHVGTADGTADTGAASGGEASGNGEAG
jgi:hypothetical protein